MHATKKGNHLFVYKASTGAKPKSAQSNCKALVNTNVEDALGSLYVKRYFPPESRKKVTSFDLLNELAFCKLTESARSLNGCFGLLYGTVGIVCTFAFS